MQERTALEKIAAIVRTRNYDTDNDLAQTFMINGQRMNADSAINHIAQIAHDSLVPRKTNPYSIDYRVNGGFKYRAVIDATDKKSAKGFLFSEFVNGETVKIESVKRGKR
jgi:hypothetical protein